MSTSAATTETGAAPAESVGLHAFASEAAPLSDVAPPPAAASARSRALVIALAAIALIEAGPAALWLQARLRPPAALPAATPPVEAAAAAPLLPAAPCTATPDAASETKTAEARPVATTPPPAAPPAMVAGMMAVTSPVPMRMYVKGRLVGTTEADSIMLPVGTHDVELANDAVGYRTRRSVTIQAGRTSAIRLDAPPGTLNVNALPWAEVWIDNQRVGETPIGNFQTPIGQHEIVFRHPELGERRTTVLVTLKQPARVSMDLRKK